MNNTILLQTALAFDFRLKQNAVAIIRQNSHQTRLPGTRHKCLQITHPPSGE